MSVVTEVETTCMLYLQKLKREFDCEGLPSSVNCLLAYGSDNIMFSIQCEHVGRSATALAEWDLTIHPDTPLWTVILLRHYKYYCICCLWAIQL